MNYKHWLLAGILCSVFWPIATLAQDALWKAYIAAGTKAVEQDRYDGAEMLFMVALKEAEGFGEHDPRLAITLRLLMNVSSDQKKTAQTSQLQERLLRIPAPSLEPELLDITANLDSLATRYYNQERFDDAEPLYSWALTIREKALGLDHPEVAASLNRLANLYYNQQKYEAAESLYKQALALREQILSPGHLDIAVSLNNLANLYYNQQKYEAAEPLYKQAMTILQKTLKPEHPYVADGLNNLGMIYLLRRQYTEAESVLQQALAIRMIVLESDDLNVAVSLNNLAKAYYYQHRFDQAEPLYVKAMEISRQKAGADSPILGWYMKNYALLQFAQGKPDQAEPLFQQGLTLLKAKDPNSREVATSLYELAELYQRQKKYSDAEPLYRQVLEMRERALGSDHLDVAATLASYAALLQKTSREQEAADLESRAQAIRAKDTQVSTKK
jgi:tetratricopeptide (TPR) repeat protein